MLGQVGNEHRLEQAFVVDHRLVVDVLGDQRLPLVQVDGALLVVEGLELGVFRRTGQDLQLVHCRSGLMPRHEHRGQGELLDQPHRGPHHHAGRLAGLELLQAAGQLHLLVVDAGLVEPVGHESGKVGQQRLCLGIQDLPAGLAVDAEHADGLAQADHRHDPGGPEGEGLGKEAVGRTRQGGGALEINGILADKDAGNHGLGGDDREMHIADGRRLVAGGIDAGERPAGQVFKVDPHPLAPRQQACPLGQGVQELALVFLAISGDLDAQGRQPRIDGHIHSSGIKPTGGQQTGPAIHDYPHLL